MQNDDEGMSIAAGESPSLLMTIAGCQPPASVQPFNAGDESSALRITVAVTEPSQGQNDSNDQSCFNPPRDVGNDNGDARQHMAGGAAEQQLPRGAQLKP